MIRALRARLRSAAVRVRDRLRGDDDANVWTLVPGRQYLGRHAEAGGATRTEQEAAIRDVAEQAEELERR